MSDFEWKNVATVALALVLALAVICVAIDHYYDLSAKAYTSCVASPHTHDVRDCGSRP